MIRQYFTGPWIRLMRQPSFVVCMVILLIGALGLSAGAKWLKWNFRKEPAPLRKLLSELERDALSPYQFVAERRMSPEIEKELGTTEYIDWTVEDTSAPSEPTRYLRLFVSYYTGNLDKVAHVAEICLTANGGKVDNITDYEVSVPGCGLEDAGNELPLRIIDVEFPQIKQRSQQQTVAYFFSVNGDYCCTRTQVRLKANNWRDRYAYFSKVEVSLPGPDILSRAEALAAAAKLCRTVTPILWSEHWPDWENLPQR